MKIAINSSMFARFEKFIYAETHGSGLNYNYEWRLRAAANKDYTK